MVRGRFRTGGASRAPLGVRLPIAMLLVGFLGVLVAPRASAADTPTPFPTTTSRPVPPSLPPASRPDACLVGTWWLASYDTLDTNTNDPGPTTSRYGGLTGVRMDISASGAGTWDYSNSEPQTSVIQGVHYVFDGTGAQTLQPYTLNQTFVVRGTLTAQIVRDGARDYGFVSTQVRGTLTSTWTDAEGKTHVDQLRGITTGLDFNSTWTLTCTATTLTNFLDTGTGGSGPMQSWKAVWHHERAGSPSPTAAPTPTPPNGNSESVTSTSGKLCPTTVTAGKFEPTQGVWQHDPYFDDRGGKQLSRVSSTEWRAEIPMVTARPTLIFGDSEHRDFFVITGRTTGTQEGAATVQLRASGAGGSLDVAVADLGSVDAMAPCGAERDFFITVPASKGLPEQHAFTFTGTGDYKLTAQLRADGQSVDPPITVTGSVVKTRSPLVLFVPVTLDATPTDKKTPLSVQMLTAYVRSLTDKVNAHLPDYLPLKPGGFNGFTQPIQYIGDSLRDHQSSAGSYLDAAYNKLQAWASKDPTAYQTLTAKDVLDYLSAELVRRISTAAVLGYAGRIVAVLPPDQYALIDPLQAKGGSGGYTASSKVIFLPAVANPPDTEVAHELAHTLPYSWSSREMVQACGIDYHDKGGKNANGFQIMSGTTESRASRDGTDSFMSTNQREGQWIDQCTYRHLIDALQRPTDPALLVVQGLLADDGSRVVAHLAPVYPMDGILDTDASAETGYAIVLRDAAGAVLASHPFDPAWTIHAGGQDSHRSVVAFNIRVPRPDGVRTVEVVGPNGALDSVRLTTQAPSVRITSPSDGTEVSPDTQMLTVHWDASTANGSVPLATVLASGDGGQTWGPVAVERPVTQIDVTLPDGSERLVKVIVTDGGSSAEATIHLNAPGGRSVIATAAIAGGGIGIVGALIAGTVLMVRRRRRPRMPDLGPTIMDNDPGATLPGGR